MEKPQNYIAVPASGKGPGVLVLPAWWGLNDFFKDLCQRLAGEGFVTLAVDLYHGKIATTVAEAEQLRSKMKGEQVKSDLLAATDQLRALPAVTGQSLGLIGFSLGAFWGLWLSLERPDAFRAVTVFYGKRNADYTSSQAAYMGHFAETDPYESASGIKKFEKSLRAAQRPAALYTYPDTGHWFFEQDRKEAYQPQAAELAWSRTVEFLKAQLKP